MQIGNRGVGSIPDVPVRLSPKQNGAQIAPRAVHSWGRAGHFPGARWALGGAYPAMVTVGSRAF
jgi:hypothetical protein